MVVEAAVPVLVSVPDPVPIKKELLPELDVEEVAGSKIGVLKKFG